VGKGGRKSARGQRTWGVNTRNTKYIKCGGRGGRGGGGGNVLGGVNTRATSYLKYSL